MAGGASASDKGKDLAQRAAQARAARQAGARVQRGKSETAYRKQAKAWDAGAVGEERGARQLERLRRSGYVVLHDVLLEPGKKWNLDHLVIGPAGALFVDDKNWRGNLSVYQGGLWRHWYAGPKSGRQSENMAREVAKVRGMAERASERLGMHVRPVICLAGAKSRQFEEIAVVDGVTIISVDRIVPWLRDHPVDLPTEKAGMWAEVARRVFPPAVKEGPVSPEDAEKARWAEAMKSGGVPPRKASPEAPGAETEAGSPEDSAPAAGWFRRFRP